MHVPLDHFETAKMIMNEKKRNFLVIIGLLSIILIFPTCKSDELLILSKVETNLVSNITDSSATVSSTFLEIGDNLGNYGHCWSKHSGTLLSDNATIIHGNLKSKTFVSELPDLSGNTKYFVRAYAKDGSQVIYGDEISFTTDETPYILITSPTAESHWIGAITYRITWNSNINENVNIALLKDSKLNQIIASDIANTGDYTWKVPDYMEYGSDYQVKVSGVSLCKAVDLSPLFKVSEKTKSTGYLAYWDVNYKLVKINTQWWMAENLKTTKLNDGTSITYNTSSWANITSPTYRDYTTAVNNNTYGMLYNWYAANTGKLCPAGWHVPSQEDWNILSTYYEGVEKAGGKLKESGTLHWSSPNEGASNEDGFTALPGGYHLTSITAIGTYGSWWSTTATDENNARVISMNYNNTYLNNIANTKKSGSSIRCVRD